MKHIHLSFEYWTRAVSDSFTSEMPLSFNRGPTSFVWNCNGYVLRDLFGSVSYSFSLGVPFTHTKGPEIEAFDTLGADIMEAILEAIPKHYRKIRKGKRQKIK